jgi:hypothetical protein
MESVVLKVKENKVKVVHKNGVVSHVFESNDLSVKGLRSQLNKEVKEYDLEDYDVVDVKFLQH